MEKKKIVGIIGASNPTDEQYEAAKKIGEFIGEQGWVLINGGLGGVMEASAKGVAKSSGLVVGVLPTSNSDDANSYVSIPIATNMGHARNVIIVQSSDICVAIGGKEGTLSEIAIALKEGKKVIGLDSWDIEGVRVAKNVDEVISLLKENLI